MWPVADLDPDYYPRLRQVTNKSQRGPKVLLDDGHWNSGGTARYAPFARLLAADGYKVSRSTQPVTASLLDSTSVFVIADALGFWGSLQRATNAVGLEGSLRFRMDAFAPGEVKALKEWVERGGGLLLAAGPAPASTAARSLALTFGVRMTGWHAEDRTRAAIAGKPGFVEFREGAGLVAHPILTGLPAEGREEPVQRVATFGGQSLARQEGGAFLELGPEAKQFPTVAAETLEGRSAAGMAQGLAFPFGKGRVVVLADPSMLTAQLVRSEGQQLRLGINMRDRDNQQLAVNIVRWLARLL